MRILLFIFSCVLLMHLFPVEKWDAIACAAQTSENTMAELKSDDASDILYDEDTRTLLSTILNQSDDVIPSRLNQWEVQLRVLSSRLQHRSHRIVLMVKRFILCMSDYLTTLINHITQFYSTLKLFGWQYAADCYVFAFRQIII